MKNFELIHGSDNYDTQMLYFTNHSLSKDENFLYFISNEKGKKNLYIKNRQTGEVTQITDDRNEKTESGYAGLGGRVGLGPSASDYEGNILYYLLNNVLYAAAADGESREILPLDKTEYFSLPNISSDGKYMCIAGAQAEILDNSAHLQWNEIDKRVLKNHYYSHIYVIDLVKKEIIKKERVPDAWVTHIQFSPVDNDLILYNHEWTSVDCGVRRIWLWDGKTHTKIRTEGEGRSKDDWTCHEFWSEDGKYIYYHGKYLDVHAYLGRYELATGEIIEIPIDHRYSHLYGHFSLGKDGVMVSDGYYCEPGEEKPRESVQMYDSAWLTLQKPDWEKKTITVTPLLKHLSSWKTQDEHPHPIFGDRGDAVYFTSDMDGKRKIYCCKL